MSYLVGLVAIVLSSAALMLPGFAVAYAARFRSRTWGAVVLSLGMVLAVLGWLAAFSIAGLVLILVGLPLFGAGAEGMAFAGRASGQRPVP